MKLRFSDCELDLERFTLSRAGVPVHVEPQVFDLLACLAQKPGEILSKEELVDVVWNGLSVSDATISARISAARAAIGDDGRSQSVIRTVHRRGFEFRPEVTAIDVGKRTAAQKNTISAPPGVNYCASKDGTAIAWSEHGTGPTLVRIGHWLSHLELDWDSLVWRPMIDRLSTGRRLVRYDQRGTGMSDRSAPLTGLDSWVEDLEAVIDASGTDRVHLFAASQASPVAIAFAARSPGRVEKLVIYGGYALGRALRPIEQSDMDEPTMLGMLRAGWGKPESPFMKAFESLYLPDATAEQLEEQIKMQMATIGSDRVAELRALIDRFDVTSELKAVQAETLVLHADRDAIQPFSQGQKIAAAIPKAKFHRLDSRNHVPLPHLDAWEEMMSELDEFLTT